MIPHTWNEFSDAVKERKREIQRAQRRYDRMFSAGVIFGVAALGVGIWTDRTSMDEYHRVMALKGGDEAIWTDCRPLYLSGRIPEHRACLDDKRSDAVTARQDARFLGDLTGIFLCGAGCTLMGFGWFGLRRSDRRADELERDPLNALDFHRKDVKNAGGMGGGGKPERHP